MTTRRIIVNGVSFALCAAEMLSRIETCPSLYIHETDFGEQRKKTIMKTRRRSYEKSMSRKYKHIPKKLR